MITSSLSHFGGGGGFDEIVHINIWYRMMMSTKLSEVRDLNSTIS